jgi:hypothetical protein
MFLQRRRGLVLHISPRKNHLQKLAIRQITTLMPIRRILVAAMINVAVVFVYLLF